MNNMNKAKRRLIVVALILLAVLAVVYVLTVYDSELNFYKKFRVKNFAESHIAENCPDFQPDDIDVYYDKTGKLYIADCKSRDEIITLNYNTHLDMKYDSYSYEKFASIAESYQKDTEKKLKEALEDADIPCERLTVYVTLNEIDKEKVVYSDAEIRNEKIECIVEYACKDNEFALDKSEFAELSKKVADCIYSQIDEDARVNVLKIKYAVDDSKTFTLSWVSHMQDLSIEELVDKIRD